MAEKEKRIRAGDPEDARWQPAPGMNPETEKPIEKPPVENDAETEEVPSDMASPRDLPKEPLEAPISPDKLQE